MNILLTIHESIDLNSRSSGAAGSTLQLGEAYKQLGHDVSYFPISDLPAALQQLPFYLRRLVFPEALALHLLQGKRSAQSYDVIDASTGDAWLWATLAPVLSKVSAKTQPLLVTRSHGLEHLYHLQYLEEAQRGIHVPSWRYRFYRGGLQLWEVARSLSTADLVLVLNQTEKDYIAQQLGVPEERIHRVKNGMPDRFFQRPFEPTPTAADAPLRIAQIGTYDHRKGVQHGAPALNRLMMRYPQLQVSFFGTGCTLCTDEEQVYADFDASLRDRITVVPRYDLESLPDLLRGHHIKLFPTLCDAFGKALIEAMACGLAPVTTSAAGPAEIVEHGVDGLVIPLRDPTAIEQSIEALIRDRPLLDRLRRNAQATAQNYSWQSTAKHRLALYTQGIAANKTGATPLPISSVRS